MSSVDSRIVTAKFDNKQFESAAATTMATLGKLTKSMDLGASAKASGFLSNLGNFAKNPFGSLSSGITGVSGKFVALASVAATAMSRITNSAINAGLSFFKQFSGLEGLKAGFAEYETQMGSIQTILANTGLTGQKGLDKVNAKLKELNTYSDKTIYNFSEMAKNIGTFTAAGVDLNTSVTSIKGIANIAALSGSNAQQASTAMYQLSQAIAAGKVGLQDWNSVVNAGMGGKIFQQALINTAVAMGDIKESAVSVDKATGQMQISGQSFRESIMAAPGKKSWLTSGVLTNTLSQFSGDLDKAQLKAQGFTDAQIVDIQKQAKAAQDAATKVKTFTQLIGTLQEAIGSGWAQTFGIVIGDFGESKKLFTGLSNYIGGFIAKSAQQRNKMLQDWKDNGGRDALLGGLENLWRVAVKIIRPIHNAFRDIFPRSTGEQLANITKAFEKFTKGLLFGKKYSVQIKEVFKGIFTVFKIIGIVIGAAIKYVADFFGIIAGGGGGSALLAIAAAVAKVVTAIGDWLLEGDRLKKFFNALIEARNSVLRPLVGAIGAVVEAFVALFSGDTGGFFDKLGQAGDFLKTLFGLLQDKVETVAGVVSNVFATIGDAIKQFASTATGVVGTVFDSIASAADFVSGIFDFKMGVDSGPLDTMTTRVEAMGSAVKKTSGFWSSFFGLLSSVGTSVFSRIAPLVEGIGKFFDIIGNKLLDAAKNMSFTDVVQALNLAILWSLVSTIKQFSKSLQGVFGAAEGVYTSMSKTFDQLTGSLKTMEQDVKANIILKIATAVGLLAASLFIIATIPAKSLGRSLGAIGGLMLGLVTAMAAFTKFGPTGLLQMSALAVVMIPLAGAILILSAAAKVMETVSWESLGKVGAVLTGLVVAMAVLGAVGPTAAIGALGLLVLAPALLMFAGVIKLYDKLKTDTLKDGLTAIGAALLVLAVGATAMVASLPGALAMLVLAPALILLAGALKIYSKFDVGEIAKSLILLGGSLLIIAAAANAMLLALPGAVAIAIIAAALVPLSASLKVLGSMSLGEIAKALGTLVAVLVILGVAGVALAPVVPIIIALGGALFLLGAAMVLAGGGMFLFATAFALLAATGTAGIAVLTATIVAVAATIPLIMEQIGLGVQALAKVLREAGPPLIGALGVVLRKFLNEIRKSVPQFGKLMDQLIKTGLTVVRNRAPQFIATAFFVMNVFLNELLHNIPKIVPVVVALVLRFLDELSKQSKKIVRGAADMILEFLHSIADTIREKSDDFGRAGGDIIAAIIEGAVKYIVGAGSTITSAFNSMISSALSNISISGALSSLGDKISNGVHDIVDGIGGLLSRSVAGGVDIPTIPSDAFQEAFEEPVITPVVDLSDVQRAALTVADILDAAPMSADLSYKTAKSIAQDVDDIEEARSSGGDGGKNVNLEYNQYNTSPKALTNVEIFRGTRNQLSQIKEVVSR